MPGHRPVLLADVLTQLHLQPGDPVIDATLGGGGHARAILEQTAPNGRLLGIEADPRTFFETQKRLTTFGSRARLVAGNFRQLTALAQAEKFPAAAGILFDLGVSAMTLEEGERGFSFQQTGPLDMRFDPSTGQPASELINHWPQTELTNIFRQFGQEPLAGPIAQAIVSQRAITPITTTSALADLVATIKRRRGRVHPATQIFQALRIAVNDELGALEEALPQTIHLLRPGGHLAIITFHSLEDRLVKQWLKSAAAAGQLEIINKHVITPSHEEILSNRRARSAKLRLARKPS